MSKNNEANRETTGRPELIIVVAAFAAFLATFNETYLNIAFTPIMEDTGVGVATVQWLAAAYMLGAAVMVPVSAFAYRSIPTKPLFIATTGLLVLGSIVCALAHTFPLILAGRIIQALGTGMLIPIGMNITLEVAPREKLGAYMGIMGAMTTLGPSLSVIVSGMLLSFFTWHMLFWVFAGLSALCLLSGVLLLGNIAHLTHPKLDALSVSLIGIALIGLLYGISTLFTGNRGIAVCSCVAGLLCLILFVKRQKVLPEPLIDLR
ncbi:MAG: MFS transporter, partial [Firmicutes bacterium]|nr:MFS transporter [Bacillota bacterium]